MKKGRKIWNLNNAIWTLQGRHREMVHFADYVYETPFEGPKGFLEGVTYYLPARKNGSWDYLKVNGRKLDKTRFEEFKTQYYKLEGWDPATGWPMRNTLESLGLAYVAEALKEKQLKSRENEVPR
jgi:aldehyde:ferredoxin oxidoreductase